MKLRYLSLALVLIIMLSTTVYAHEILGTSTELPAITGIYTIELENTKSNACTHDYKDMILGDLVGENCSYYIYNYTQECNRCDSIIGGHFYIPKSTPTHAFTWRTISCNGTTHIYEKICSSCGFATETTSLPCNGFCAEFNSADHDHTDI